MGKFLNNGSFEQVTKVGLLPSFWVLETNMSSYKFQEFDILDSSTGEVTCYEEFECNLMDLFDSHTDEIDISFRPMPVFDWIEVKFDSLGVALYENFEWLILDLFEDTRFLGDVDLEDKITVEHNTKFVVDVFIWEDSTMESRAREKYELFLWGGIYTKKFLLELLCNYVPYLEFNNELKSIEIMTSSPIKVIFADNEITDFAFDKDDMSSDNVMYKNITNNFIEITFPIIFEKLIPIYVGTYPTGYFYNLVLYYHEPFPFGPEIDLHLPEHFPSGPIAVLPTLMPTFTL